MELVRHRTSLALLSVFMTAGCLVAPHDGFATPQETVLTFQSAYARGDDWKEYDCFAQDFRREQQIDQPRWSLARGQLFAPFGTLGRWLLRCDSLEDNLDGGARFRNHDGERTRLDYSLLGHGFSIELEAEATFLLPDPTGALGAAPLAWPLTTDSAFMHEGRLIVVIEAKPAVAERLLRDGVPWAEIEERWKICGVAERDGDAPDLPLPEPSTLDRGHSGTTVIDSSPLRPTELGRKLGVVKLRFELWLSREDDFLGCFSTGTVVHRDAHRLRWEAERR